MNKIEYRIRFIYLISLQDFCKKSHPFYLEINNNMLCESEFSEKNTIVRHD